MKIDPSSINHGYFSLYIWIAKHLNVAGLITSFYVCLYQFEESHQSQIMLGFTVAWTGITVITFGLQNI